MPDDLYDVPAEVSVFQGAVVILGPGQMVGAFTADAAEATAVALLAAAVEARSWEGPDAPVILVFN
ncbi:MAG: hypothetical protein EOO83_02805 [Oxalobacteraceae bacterium]|nr:MAG: hypothetical protein EOO83_02805 [Oxalobacteraceae bacterium]